MNKIDLVGRTTKDIELKILESGKVLANFSLAVDRRFKDKDGNRKVDFINIIAWGKPAETLSTYVKKGDRLGVSGRLETGSYEKEDGTKGYIAQVVVEDFDLLGTKRNEDQTEETTETAEDGFTPVEEDDELPF